MAPYQIAILLLGYISVVYIARLIHVLPSFINASVLIIVLTLDHILDVQAPLQ